MLILICIPIVIGMTIPLSTLEVLNKYMASEKVNVSSQVKIVLENIKKVEGHLTIDSVIRSRLRSEDMEMGT